MVKAKWILFSIEAPQFIWVAAALLLLGTLAQSIRLWRLIAREQALHRRVIGQLEAMQTEDRSPARTGLTEAAYEAVVQVFREHLPLLPAWHNFEAQMLRQADAAGQFRWWVTASASSAFNATAVIEPRVNQSFLRRFQAWSQAWVCSVRLLRSWWPYSMCDWWMGNFRGSTI